VNEATEGRGQQAEDEWNFGLGIRVHQDLITEESAPFIRRLLLAEDAMLNVSEAARAWTAVLPISRRARLVVAAGLASMFARPFVKDDEGKRFRTEHWRPASDRGLLFDHLIDLRHKVFAHADNSAGHVDVIDVDGNQAEPYNVHVCDLRVFDLAIATRLLEPDELREIAKLADEMALAFRRRLDEFAHVD
jgi:hypothetical protein